ncbi:MAG: DUF393 domain-containing protein [Saprospiraceae bacterium]|nr:DUF393 domain-containing protein [Saprospiraceae bacterium]
MSNTELKEISQQYPVLFYDGSCRLCNWSVQFILKRDSKRIFRFCSLQSESGKTVSVPPETSQMPDSIILLYKNNYYLYSDAVIRILIMLGSWYTWLAYIINIFPKTFRNYFYRLIAKNRYRLFGRYNTCLIPSSQFQNQFIL